MRIRKRYLFYVLAFASTIIAAGVSAIDATINSLFIPNAFAFSLSCFLVGSIVTFIVILFFSIPVKKSKSIGSKIIDPSFTRIRFVLLKEQESHAVKMLIRS